MKNYIKKTASTDVKNFVIIIFTIALVALLFISIVKSETIFEKVFILFTNLCTAVFTHNFTKTKENSVDNNAAEELKEKKEE